MKIIVILTVTVFLSCKNGKTTNDNKVEEINTKQTQQVESPKEKDFNFTKTHNTKNYSLTIESDNREMSTIKIYTKGMEYEFNETIEVEGQVIDTYMADLNQDGFKEFYIKFSQTDDSGNIGLLGFISNRGKSISMIEVEEPTDLRDVNTDKLIIENDKIIREFKTNGEIVNYRYKLSLGEASYVLQPSKQ